MEKQTKEQELEKEQKEIKGMAIRLHNSYEMWSKKYKWKTQSVCNEKAFDDLPKENKMVMFAMGKSILDLLAKARTQAISEFKNKLKAELLTKGQKISRSKLKAVIDKTAQEMTK
jgi:TRAP-type mannitol/chloroaromatic compound transport system substrate-binding protein